MTWKTFVARWCALADSVLCAVRIRVIRSRSTCEVVRFSVYTCVSLFRGSLAGRDIAVPAVVFGVEDERWYFALDPSLVDELREDGTLNLLLDINGGNAGVFNTWPLMIRCSSPVMESGVPSKTFAV